MEDYNYTDFYLNQFLTETKLKFTKKVKDYFNI